MYLLINTDTGEITSSMEMTERVAISANTILEALGSNQRWVRVDND